MAPPLRQLLLRPCPTWPGRYSWGASPWGHQGRSLPLPQVGRHVRSACGPFACLPPASLLGLIAPARSVPLPHPVTDQDAQLPSSTMGRGNSTTPAAAFYGDTPSDQPRGPAAIIKNRQGTRYHPYGSVSGQLPGPFRCSRGTLHPHPAEMPGNQPRGPAAVIKNRQGTRYHPCGSVSGQLPGPFRCSRGTLHPHPAEMPGNQPRGPAAVIKNRQGTRYHPCGSVSGQLPGPFRCSRGTLHPHPAEMPGNQPRGPAAVIKNRQGTRYHPCGSVSGQLPGPFRCSRGTLHPHPAEMPGDQPRGPAAIIKNRQGEWYHPCGSISGQLPGPFQPRGPAAINIWAGVDGTTPAAAFQGNCPGHSVARGVHCTLTRPKFLATSHEAQLPSIYGQGFMAPPLRQHFRAMPTPWGQMWGGPLPAAPWPHVRGRVPLRGPVSHLVGSPLVVGMVGTYRSSQALYVPTIPPGIFSGHSQAWQAYPAPAPPTCGLSLACPGTRHSTCLSWGTICPAALDNIGRG